MDQGISGTAQVVKYKTTLKGARQKSTMAMNNLTRKIGMFKECVNNLDEDDKGSTFLNDELKAVLEAKKTVEATYETVSQNVIELTALMSEMQLADPALSETHVDELKKEVIAEEKKYAERSDKVKAMLRESNKLLVQWKYKPPDPAPLPPTVAYAPHTTKRRFVAVDSFKPKLLNMDTSYEDFLDFIRRFIIYTKACYEGVPVVDGLPAITF